MAVNLPYVMSLTNLSKVLEKIQAASTPERFTADFLGTKLGLSGGSARPLIPFLKKVGFLSSDGIPTSLYKEFRNQSQSRTAMAAAFKHGYSPLYEANEYVHELSDSKLKGLILQLTGIEESSQVVGKIIGSIKILKEFADFEDEEEVEREQIELENELQQQQVPVTISSPDTSPAHRAQNLGLNLSYTINLNLPATSDISVFNAIFKSLKDNLLKE